MKNADKNLETLQDLFIFTLLGGFCTSADGEKNRESGPETRNQNRQAPEILRKKE